MRFIDSPIVKLDRLNLAVRNRTKHALMANAEYDEKTGTIIIEIHDDLGQIVAPYTGEFILKN